MSNTRAKPPEEIRAKEMAVMRAAQTLCDVLASADNFKEISRAHTALYYSLLELKDARGLL